MTDEAAADALSVPHGYNSLAGALGAFGNHLSNRGMEFSWPGVTNAHDERVRLTMDEAPAAAVRQAL